MSDARNDLVAFVDEVCEAAPLRIESDLGSGFVRLRTSEAERRQAAQDIRSSEDIVIELLRNARDAHARHIFLAVQRDERTRTLVMIDDGDGIPENLFERIFDARVTSKLDTAHMDKWGMHGRGMALYSISVNAEEARVQASELGCGTSIVVRSDLGALGERSDQSTFPRFERKDDGAFTMRGPRNILRVAAEFALECKRTCAVHLGSPTEIAATLYAFGMSTTTPAERAFSRTELADGEGVTLPQRLAFATDPDDLAARAGALGLDLSPRSARRILNGEIAPTIELYERLRTEGMAGAVPSEGSDGTAAPNARRARSGGDVSDVPRVRGLRLSEDERAALAEGVVDAFAPIAEAYFLEQAVEPDITVRDGRLVISLPLLSS